MYNDVTEKLARAFRIAGRRFRIKNIDPRDTLDLDLKTQAADLLARGVERLSSLQERLWAQDRWAMLLIFQALDAAGKDSTIKHVMSGINPAGCDVSSFKQPSSQELDHDFLWRSTVRLPERGRIGIFNRSYYEEVLVVRVHPELLARQHLPKTLVDDRVWDQRLGHIKAFESYLADQGTIVRKFFLHVSKDEQRRRFMKRLDDPEKNWKFSAADVRERQHYEEYLDAYENAIRHTATDTAPWFVVPADHKWFTRLVVASVVIEGLEAIAPSFPKLDEEQKRQHQLAREALESEQRGKERKR